MGKKWFNSLTMAFLNYFWKIVIVIFLEGNELSILIWDIFWKKQINLRHLYILYDKDAPSNIKKTSHETFFEKKNHVTKKLWRIWHGLSKRLSLNLLSTRPRARMHTVSEVSNFEPHLILEIELRTWLQCAPLFWPNIDQNPKKNEFRA